jgi:hypothetical protein
VRARLVIECVVLWMMVPFIGYGSTTIPLQINDGGYIFLTVRINGDTEAKFMLDTGAGVNVISQRLFERIRTTVATDGLHTGTRHNGEQITGMLYRVPSLSIGTYSQENVTIGIYDGLRECDGLLSLDYFRDTPFTIDFKNQQLIIEDRDELKKIKEKGLVVPIKIQTNGKHELQFFVDLCFNDDVQCRAEFDTGAGFNMLMLHPSYMDRLKIKTPSQPGNYGYYIFSTTLPKLMYCAHMETLVNSDVFVGFKEGLIYDGLVGTAMFRNKRLTINIPGSEIIAH